MKMELFAFWAEKLENEQISPNFTKFH